MSTRVSRLKAVVFDLGGTLLEYDSPELSYMDLHYTGLRGLHSHLSHDCPDLPAEETFCEYMLARTEERWRRSLARMEGANTVDVFTDFLPKMGVEFHNADMNDLLWAFYRPMAGYIRAYEDTHETLSSLRSAGYRIGLISNTTWPGILHDADLTRFDLMDMFDVRSYSSESKHAKPHSAIFLETLAALGTEPGEAVFIGDRLHDDVSGAQGAGMKGVLKIVAHREETDTTVQPDAVIHTLRELPLALRALFSEEEHTVH